MFIQIMQGRCTDKESLHRLADRWTADLAPTAPGWLGSTFGVTDDDQFIGVVRFTDKAAAMANSQRPEQSAWWAEAEKCFSGPVTFHDTEDVTLMLGGGSDDATFVQVVQGKVRDADRLRTLMSDSDQIHVARPDILGGTLAIDEDGTFTETVAFTSEAAARRGETEQMPAEYASAWEDAASDVHFYDLHEPWFSSAR